MTGKRSGTESEAYSTQERLGKSAAPTKDPTHCDFCGKRLESGSALRTRLTVPPVSALSSGLPFKVSRVSPIDFLLDTEGKVEAGAKSNPLASRVQGLRSVKG